MIRSVNNYTYLEVLQIRVTRFTPACGTMPNAFVIYKPCKSYLYILYLLFRKRFHQPAHMKRERDGVFYRVYYDVIISREEKENLQTNRTVRLIFIRLVWIDKRYIQRKVGLRL